MSNEIRLFNGTAPGSEGLDLKEEILEEATEDGSVKSIAQFVLSPALIPCHPEKPGGTCLMVIPGGGYKRLVINKEGSEIARWLNARGITVFILKHRMPEDGHKNGTLVPLQDAQRGMRVIRSLSGKYGFKRIGVMGFSAGAHVAATLATCFDKKVYEGADETDGLSARPDFQALLYPAVSLRSYGSGDRMPVHAREHGRGILGEFPVDELVTPAAPPAFVTVADDDVTTPAENSINYYLSLRKSGIAAELHVFRKGSHGFGLAEGKGPVSGWKGLFEQWLENLPEPL